MRIIRKPRPSYKIRKGIPIDKAKFYDERKALYPFAEMKVKDCLEITVKGNTRKAIAKRVAGNLQSYLARTKSKSKFTMRSYLKYIRVWRIK